MAKLELLSRTIYDANGVQTVWDFNFAGGYILPEHVKAYYEVGSVRTPVTVNLIGANQAYIVPAVPDGAVLTIYRDTPKNAPLVDFVDRGTVSEVALDTVAKQAVFVAAEAQDSAATAATEVAVSAAGVAQAAALAAAADSESAALSAISAAASAAVSAGAVAAHKAELASTGGANAVGYSQIGTGAANRTVQQVLRDIEINVNGFIGADPTGSVDSYAAFVSAVNATPAGGTLRINGYYRLSAPLVITKTMSIVGVDSRVGNVPSGASSKSFVYFDNNTDGFVADGCVLTLDRVVVSGIGPTSTKYGVTAQNPNNSLILENAVVQGFNRGLSLSGGYYNKFKNSTLTHNANAIVADNCYNMAASGLTVNCNTDTKGTGLTLLNGSSMVMLGGSIENHGGVSSYGAGLFGGSSLTCVGTYFEGDTARKDAWNVYLAADASFVGMGLHVYLTGCARHISTESGGATGTRVLSRNTRFIYPTDAQVCDVYTLLNTDTKADWKIGGDNWDIAAGVNVKYMGTGSATVSYGVGNFDIQYPANHPLYGKNLLSTPIGDSGVWTPTLSSTGTPPTVTYLVQTGTYLKIGNRVFVTCQIRGTISAVGSGSILITGLPFPAVTNLPGVSLGLATMINAPAVSGNYVTGSTIALSGTYNTAAGAYLTFSAQYDV